MLCQNCGKNEATTHIKQVVNGDTAEQHLCADCAQQLGYGNMFSGFGLSLADMFGGFFGESAQSKGVPAPQERCQKCGSSFHDIVRDGRVGCADCYRTFYDRLKPSLQRIHGKVTHNGKVKQHSAQQAKPAVLDEVDTLAQYRQEMQEAIQVQDFERAAELRDKIKQLEQERPEDS